MRIMRSSAVVIAVTMQRLLEDATRSWTFEEGLVLTALRRSKNSLEDATVDELRDYVAEMSGPQFKGMLNNVKGIYHELLFVHAENIDGDEVTARVFEATNHPGADVEFLVDGEVIREVQLKATSSLEYLGQHIEKYPDIEILGTSEVADQFEGVASSGFTIEEITDQARETLEGLDGEGIAKQVADGLAPTALVSAAFVAGDLLKSKELSIDELKRIGEDVAVAAVAAFVLDLLL